MSTIAEELTRIQNAKASIAASIVAKGVEVPASTKIDCYAAFVDQISQGGEMAVIEGTYTPASDVASTNSVFSDNRIVGKTIVAVSIWCKAVKDNAEPLGIAAIFASDKSFCDVEASAVITNGINGCGSIGGANGVYLPSYCVMIRISENQFSLYYSANRYYKGGYTYKWKAYVL